MYDKAVRRRRAVLAVLVVLCLVLLTAYFGEGSNGGLHSVQRGAMEVLTPIQEGANKALKPPRDLFGWFGDTLDAKSQRDKLKAERDVLLAEREQPGLERRRRGERPRRQRRGPGRQGAVGLGLLVGGDASDRPGLRRLRAGRQVL
jgi:rod shape-determining protein MreC